jgi:hypothetical protein
MNDLITGSTWSRPCFPRTPGRSQVVSLLTGIRTEEARALRWSHVVAWVQDGAAWAPVTEAGFDHERFVIYVWCSVRAKR